MNPRTMPLALALLTVALFGWRDFGAHTIDAAAEHRGPNADRPNPHRGPNDVADERAAAHAVAAPPPVPVPGRVRMLSARTGCDVGPFSPGGPGVPYFVADPAPRVGEPFRVQWSTKPTAPGEPPAWLSMLLLSFSVYEPAWPLFSLGASGCNLNVPADVVLVPAANTILTQQGGRIFLDWTPHAGLEGTVFYAQLAVLAPGTNPASLLFSPGMEVLIGW